MQNLGADFVIKAFNAESTPAVSSAGADESAPTSAIDASSSPESVLAPTSIGPVAYTVPYPSSNESTSSSSSMESLPTPSSEPILVQTSDVSLAPSSEPLTAPTSDSPPAPSSEVQSIPTSVLAVAESSQVESSPASSSPSCPALPSASPTIIDVPGASSQSGGPGRTRCQ
jgi:autotransporter family porin